MTLKEWALRLHGREIGDEVTDSENAQAKADGVVIVFGYSDDNVEFWGAIYDEVGAYDGKTMMIDKEGVVPTWDRGDEKDLEDAREYFRREGKGKKLEVVWCDGPSWTYKTAVPHETFDIMEDGEVFCRGIVMSIDNL